MLTQQEPGRKTLTHLHTQTKPVTNVRSCRKRPCPPPSQRLGSLCTTQGTLGLCYNKLLKPGQVLARTLCCTNQLWCGHTKSHLDHCGIMAQTVVLSPLDKLGTHLQLGELETRQKIPHFFSTFHLTYPYFLHTFVPWWHKSANHWHYLPLHYQAASLSLTHTHTHTHTHQWRRKRSGRSGHGRYNFFGQKKVADVVQQRTRNRLQ